MSTLSLKKVSFQYQTGFTLQQIDLQVSHQSFLAVIGPNGSGKTTLLRLITRLLKPSHGCISINQKSLEHFTSRELARRMAVISSDQHFEFPFSVVEVVSMGRYPYLGRFTRLSRSDRRVVDEALAMTKTSHLKDRPISQISSGERQRVLLARAVAQEPEILILDEPNAHLDINHQASIFRLLQFLNQKRGVSVIAVLHDLGAAAAFCQELILINNGKMIKRGKPTEVITTKIIHETYGTDVLVSQHPADGFPLVSYRKDSNNKQ